MARYKSQFISSSDIAARVFKAYANAVIDAGGTDADIRSIETDKEMAMSVGRVVMSKQRPAVLKIRVKLYAGRSFQDAIRAGNYRRVNPGIAEVKFPWTKREEEVEQEIVLVHFNKLVLAEDVDIEFKRLKLRHAFLEEFLAIGEQHPKLQLQFPIVGCGSLWRDPGGFRYVPELKRHTFGRHLGLCLLDFQVHPDFRFAAVCEH